jgi:hypothetical protein
LCHYCHEVILDPDLQGKLHDQDVGLPVARPTYHCSHGQIIYQDEQFLMGMTKEIEFNQKYNTKRDGRSTLNNLTKNQMCHSGLENLFSHIIDLYIAVFFSYYDRPKVI